MLQEKRAVFSTRFKEWKSLKSKGPLKCLRTDRAGEYMSQEFENWCKEQAGHINSRCLKRHNKMAPRRDRTILNIYDSLHAEGEEYVEGILGSILPLFVKLVPNEEDWRYDPGGRLTGSRKLIISESLEWKSCPCKGEGGEAHEAWRSKSKMLILGLWWELQWIHKLYNPVTQKLVMSRQVPCK